MRKPLFQFLLIAKQKGANIKINMDTHTKKLLYSLAHIALFTGIQSFKNGRHSEESVL